jgi:hypothetical protein
MHGGTAQSGGMCCSLCSYSACSHLCLHQSCMGMCVLLTVAGGAQPACLLQCHCPTKQLPGEAVHSLPTCCERHRPASSCLVCHQPGSLLAGCLPQQVVPTAPQRTSTC